MCEITLIRPMVRDFTVTSRLLRGLFVFLHLAAAWLSSFLAKSHRWSSTGAQGLLFFSNWLCSDPGFNQPTCWFVSTCFNIFSGSIPVDETIDSIRVCWYSAAVSEPEQNESCKLSHKPNYCWVQCTVMLGSMSSMPKNTSYNHFGVPWSMFRLTSN